VQVQGHLQAEAAVPGRADPDPGGDRGVAGIQLAALGHRQQRRLETGAEADREQLLGVGAGTALAAHVLGDRQLELQAAVGGAAVAGPAAFGDRLGGVEDSAQWLGWHLATLDISVSGEHPSDRCRLNGGL
jgi:hypothetical protein